MSRVFKITHDDFGDFPYCENIKAALLQGAIGFHDGRFTVEEIKPIPTITSNEVAVLDEVDIPQGCYVAFDDEYGIAREFDKGDVVDLENFPQLKSHCTIKTEIDWDSVPVGALVIVNHIKGYYMGIFKGHDKTNYQLEQSTWSSPYYPKDGVVCVEVKVMPEE